MSCSFISFCSPPTARDAVRNAPTLRPRCSANVEIFVEARREVQDWVEGDFVRDWRRYVGARTRSVWSTLTFEQREAVVEDAAEIGARWLEAYVDANR